MTTVIVTDSTPPTLVRDLIEMRTRRLMAARAALPVTWEHRGERAELLVEIGLSLDEWLALGS